MSLRPAKGPTVEGKPAYKSSRHPFPDHPGGEGPGHQGPHECPSQVVWLLSVRNHALCFFPALVFICHLHPKLNVNIFATFLHADKTKVDQPRRRRRNPVTSLAEPSKQ